MRKNAVFWPSCGFKSRPGVRHLTNPAPSSSLSALLTWGSFIPTASASAETLLGPLLSPVMTFCWWELDAGRPHV